HRDKRVKLVVTDGVFSMDGDIAPLAAIVERAERFQALVMVDDAHASGVLGANGRGSVNHFGLDGRVDLQIGTLSKAMGVLGGYAQGIGYPTVPEGRARIRTIVTSVHTEQQLDRALEAFAKAGKELGVVA